MLSAIRTISSQHHQWSEPPPSPASTRGVTEGMVGEQIDLARQPATLAGASQAFELLPVRAVSNETGGGDSDDSASDLYCSIVDTDLEAERSPASAVAWSSEDSSGGSSDESWEESGPSTEHTSRSDPNGGRSLPPLPHSNIKAPVILPYGELAPLAGTGGGIGGGTARGIDLDHADVLGPPTAEQRRLELVIAFAASMGMSVEALRKHIAVAPVEERREILASIEAMGKVPPYSAGWVPSSNQLQPSSHPQRTGGDRNPGLSEKSNSSDDDFQEPSEFSSAATPSFSAASEPGLQAVVLQKGVGSSQGFGMTLHPKYLTVLGVEPDGSAAVAGVALGWRLRVVSGQVVQELADCALLLSQVKSFELLYCQFSRAETSATKGHAAGADPTLKRRGLMGCFAKSKPVAARTVLTVGPNNEITPRDSHDRRV